MTAVFEITKLDPKGLDTRQTTKTKWNEIPIADFSSNICSIMGKNWIKTC